MLRVSVPLTVDLPLKFLQQVNSLLQLCSLIRMNFHFVSVLCYRLVSVAAFDHCVDSRVFHFELCFDVFSAFCLFRHIVVRCWC